MSGSARRLDVVLEYQEDEGWAVVANLVDYYGKQQRRTLRRFPSKDEAGEELERMFEALVKKS